MNVEPVEIGVIAGWEIFAGTKQNGAENFLRAVCFEITGWLFAATAFDVELRRRVGECGLNRGRFLVA